MSKLLHSKIARLEVWLTSSRAEGEGVPIVAVPATTVPPVGSASTAWAAAGWAATSASGPHESINIVRQRLPAGEAFAAMGALASCITTSTRSRRRRKARSVSGAERHEYSPVAIAVRGNVAADRLGVFNRRGKPGVGADAQPTANRLQPGVARLARQRLVLVHAPAFVIGERLDHPEPRRRVCEIGRS